MTSIKWIGCSFMLISKLRKIRMQFLLNYTKANKPSDFGWRAILSYFFYKKDTIFRMKVK